MKAYLLCNLVMLALAFGGQRWGDEQRKYSDSVIGWTQVFRVGLLWWTAWLLVGLR